MSETPFFKTRMGQRFYEHTMPEWVKELERLNDLLERPAAERDRPHLVESEIIGCYGCLPENLSPWILTDDVH